MIALEERIAPASWGRMTLKVVLILPAPLSSASSSRLGDIVAHWEPTFLTTTAKLLSTLAMRMAKTGLKPPKGLAISMIIMATIKLGNMNGTVMMDLRKLAPGKLLL
jgi:hypothetical protein